MLHEAVHRDPSFLAGGCDLILAAPYWRVYEYTSVCMSVLQVYVYV